MALLHLVTLLPSDPLSDRIKAHLVEKMRLQPNITSLEEITTNILSQEADDVAKKSTLQQANRVNQVTEEKDPERKKYKCRVCSKSHARWQCQHACEFCGKKGHRQETCWHKHPKLAPSASVPQAPPSLPPSGREPTPGLPATGRGGRNRRRSSGRRSDRGSSYERSASEPESPAKTGRKRHRSNRVLIHYSPSKTESSSTGLTESSLFGPSGQLGFSRNQLFPEDSHPATNKRVNRIKRSSITHLGDEDQLQGNIKPNKACLFNDDEATFHLSHLFDAHEDGQDGDDNEANVQSEQSSELQI